MDSDSTKTDGFVQFQAWLATHKKKVAIGGGTALAVLVVAVVAVANQAQREARASAALSSVRVSARIGEPVPPGAAEALLQVAQDYSGTRAAEQALLRRAGLFFERGDYSAALDAFNEVVAKHPNGQWAGQAMFGVAASLDAQKKSGEAIDKYEELRRRYSTDSVIEEVRLALARLYEDENRPEEAYKIYQEISVAGPQSGLGTEAGLRLEELIKRYPQLTNQIAAAVSPSTLSGTNLQVIENIIDLTAQSNLAPAAAVNDAASGTPPLNIQIAPPPEPAPPVPPITPEGSEGAAPLPTPTPDQP